jgi:hypothetical protein
MMVAVIIFMGIVCFIVFFGLAITKNCEPKTKKIGVSPYKLYHSHGGCITDSKIPDGKVCGMCGEYGGNVLQSEIVGRYISYVRHSGGWSKRWIKFEKKSVKQ